MRTHTYNVLIARGLSQTVVAQIQTLVNNVIADLQAGGNNIFADISSVLSILGLLNQALLGGGSTTVSAKIQGTIKTPLTPCLRTHTYNALIARGLSQTVVAQIQTLLNGVLTDLQNGATNIGTDINSVFTILGLLNQALFGSSTAIKKTS